MVFSSIDRFRFIECQDLQVYEQVCFLTEENSVDQNTANLSLSRQDRARSGVLQIATTCGRTHSSRRDTLDIGARYQAEKIGLCRRLGDDDLTYPRHASGSKKFLRELRNSELCQIILLRYVR